ncbi:MAG: hypothetical protein ACJ76F_09200 [Bacteroidia bacterium]
MGQYINEVSEMDTFFSGLFDTQPDALMWVVPSFGPDKSKSPVDFTVAYCNTTLCKILNANKEDVMGASVKTSDLIDEVSRQQVLSQCHEVWSSGKSTEYTYHSPGFNKYFNVIRSKVGNGILSITRDNTLLMKTKLEKETQSSLLNQLIANSPYGICLYEAIRSMDGKIKDFRLKICNQKSADITAFSMNELYKHTVKELMVLRGQTDYFEVLIKVVETGKPAYQEYYSKTMAQWIAFSIIKFEDGYLLNYIDITKTKLLEKQAQRQSEMLEGVFDASVTGLVALEAIYGFSGKVLDFRFVMFNKACEKYISLRPEDKNRTLLSLFPIAKTNGMFDLQVKVLTSGESIVTDFYHKTDQIATLFTISLAKMGEHGIVQSFTEAIKRPE